MITTAEVGPQSIILAANRVCDALMENREHILALDQAMGDGDLGITVSKISTALRHYFQNTPAEDLGKLIIGAGMETNKAGSSTMGTLLATALMRMGRVCQGKNSLTKEDLVEMIITAGKAIQERGKANLGDKTSLDVLVPAGEAFKNAVEGGKDLAESGQIMVQAAENGRDKVTPKQSRIGRASWIGERTIGLVDPGCETMVIILRAIANK